VRHTPTGKIITKIFRADAVVEINHRQ
jgi:hypothetical protein